MKNLHIYTSFFASGNLANQWSSSGGYQCHCSVDSGSAGGDGGGSCHTGHGSSNGGGGSTSYSMSWYTLQNINTNVHVQP